MVFLRDKNTIQVKRPREVSYTRRCLYSSSFPYTTYTDRLLHLPMALANHCLVTKVAFRMAFPKELRIVGIPCAHVHLRMQCSTRHTLSSPTHLQLGRCVQPLLVREHLAAVQANLTAATHYISSWSRWVSLLSVTRMRVCEQLGRGASAGPTGLQPVHLSVKNHRALALHLALWRE